MNQKMSMNNFPTDGNKSKKECSELFSSPSDLSTLEKGVETAQTTTHH
jgi:hypothetical protein